MNDAPMNIRDTREPGHFWADNEIVDKFLPVIGLHAFAVYMLLCKFSNKGIATPSVSTLATKLGLSSNTVRKAIKALQDQALISTTPRYKNNVQLPHEYFLLTVKGTSPREVPPTSPVEVRTSSPEGGVLHHVKTDNTKINKTNRTTEDLSHSPNGSATGGHLNPTDKSKRLAEPAIPSSKETGQPATTVPKVAEVGTGPNPPVGGHPPIPADMPPAGCAWMSSTASDVTTKHLVKADGEPERNRPLCGASLPHRAYVPQLHAGQPPCAACLAKAAEKAPAPKAAPNPAFTKEVKDAFAVLCYGTVEAWDMDANAKSMMGALKKLKDPTVERLRRFYVNWQKKDFRAKDDNKPEPHQVVSKWTVYTQEGSTNGTGTQTASGQQGQAAEKLPGYTRNASLLEESLAGVPKGFGQPRRDRNRQPVS